MEGDRKERGQLDVVFVDGARQSVQVYETRQGVFFEWPGEGGVPETHAVRQENASSPTGWTRELREMHDMPVKTYDFRPARQQPG